MNEYNLDFYGENQHTLPESLRKLVAEFLGYFNSSDTVNTYRQVLDHFFAFCYKNDIHLSTLEKINERLISFYLKSSSQNGCSPTTLSLKVSVFSSFFNFLIKKKETERNPTLLLRRKYRRTLQNTTESLMIEEVGLVITRLEQNVQLAQTRRKKDSAMLKEIVIKTLFTLGLRVSELCHLKIGDVASNDGKPFLSFATKGGTLHKVGIPQSFFSELKKYIREHRNNALVHAPLFIRTGQHKTEKALSRVTVWKFIKEVCAQVGIERSISPHSCRATVATWMHQCGVPIKEIQLLLNHKSIETTSIYIKKVQWEENAPLLSELLSRDAPRQPNMEKPFTQAEIEM